MVQISSEQQVEKHLTHVYVWVVRWLVDHWVPKFGVWDVLIFCSISISFGMHNGYEWI